MLFAKQRSLQAQSRKQELNESARVVAAEKIATFKCLLNAVDADCLGGGPTQCISYRFVFGPQFADSSFRNKQPNFVWLQRWIRKVFRIARGPCIREPFPSVVGVIAYVNALLAIQLPQG